MKISLSLEELTNGIQIKRRGQRFRDNIADTLANKLPASIGAPILLNGRSFNMIYPHSFKDTSDKLTELKFTPVYSMAMIGCHVRSTNIRILVVQFDHGQYEFSDDGEQSSAFTMDGPGCDPVEVEKSHTALIRILLDNKDSEPVRHCLRHIQKHFAARVAK